jgi:hypothetical protein
MLTTHEELFALLLARGESAAATSEETLAIALPGFVSEDNTTLIVHDGHQRAVVDVRDGQVQLSCGRLNACGDDEADVGCAPHFEEAVLGRLCRFEGLACGK